MIDFTNHSPIDNMLVMNYSDVVDFFKSKSMKQDEMIESLTNELYNNNYKLMENIIEEYVLSMNEQELNTLEKTMNQISNTYEWMLDKALKIG